MTRIVLADDHPFLRQGVEAVLAARGMEVAASVEDGDQALAAIAREAPDVIILDVRMPGRSGIEALEMLRAAGDDRPVVLLSAEIDDAALRRAVKAGVNGIVLKQSALTALPDAIHAVASGQRYVEGPIVDRVFALSRQDETPGIDRLLTPRELAIARAVALGQRNREIAESVGLTEGSVKVYLHRIYQKVGVENRTALAVAMIDSGIAAA